MQFTHPMRTIFAFSLSHSPLYAVMLRVPATNPFVRGLAGNQNADQLEMGIRNPATRRREDRA
jgi:hypothetical protein